MFCVFFNQSVEPFVSSVAPEDAVPVVTAAAAAGGSSSSGFLARITTPSRTLVVEIHSFVANYVLNETKQEIIPQKAQPLEREGEGEGPKERE